jgi:hypothetical protein
MSLTPDLPTPPLVEQGAPPAWLLSVRPAGVVAAGRTWVVCGVLGLVLNAAQMLLYLDAAGRGSGRSEERAVGYLLVGIASVCFYATLIWVGRGFQRRRRWVQLPAGFVFFAATVLLLVNTVYALASWMAYLGEYTFMRPLGGGSGHLLPGWAGTSALLILLDVPLLVSAAVLLWQSARYTHWVNTGGAGPEPGAVEPAPFPYLIGFAGVAWSAIGVVWAGFVGLYALRLFAISGEFSRWSLPLRGFLVGELVLVAGVIPLLLGLLLLNGRLPSTRGAGVVGGLLMILVMIQGVSAAVFWMTPDPRYPQTLNPPTLDIVGLLLQAGLALLGLLASVACIVGNSAYRAWLRTARGLRV